jgi:hypothetical protein
MVALVDTAKWPVGQSIDYASEEEVAAIRALTTEAQSFVNNRQWRPPIAELILAFGVGPLLGLYLLRFAPGGRPEDRERWLVVGDLPTMHFETDDTPTPALALRLYCAIAQDWADNVLEGRDLSDSYPIEVDATPEHAEMLLKRIEYIRTQLIPLAR